MEKDITNTVKHLEFIQNIISRLNSNSFQVKKWSVAVLAGTLAIYANSKDKCMLLIGIFPILLFWFWDAYVLTQEKKFRYLYDDVAEIKKDNLDLKPFEMNIVIYNKIDKCKYFYNLKSTTMLLGYLPLLLMLILLFYIL